MEVVVNRKGNDSLRRELSQVLHGCRQLVSRDVRLSPITSETPIVSCQRVKAGTLARLPVLNRRKVGMTSSPHGPYVRGFKRATMAGTKGCEVARPSQSQKTGLSSDCRLQLACMKLESLVIADQLRRGEYVPEPCTHRPSSHESRERPKPLTQPSWREASTASSVIGTKS